MVRRHSVPPHALKRQNSRFKIGAGVAAAAGAGAALLAVGLCLRLTPPPAVPAPTPARVEQPWEVVDRLERLTGRVDQRWRRVTNCMDPSPTMPMTMTMQISTQCQCQ